MSVRDHLADLINKLLTSKDPNALEKLESLSLEVKAANVNTAVPSKKVRRRPALQHACCALCAWESCCGLMQRVLPPLQRLQAATCPAAATRARVRCATRLRLPPLS